jgi:hypothetical protein
MTLQKCFGLFWDLGEVQCNKCTIKKECLHKFATDTLLKLQQQNPGITEAGLSEKTRVSEFGIRHALHYRADIGFDPITTNTTETEFMATQTKKKATKKQPPKKRAAQSRSKATTKAAESNEVLNPPKTTSVQTASDVVDPKTGWFVNPVLEPGREKFWSYRHNLIRWQRERERSPAIAALKINQILETEWPRKSGLVHRVKVLKGRYLYQNRSYPTLYAVTKVIVGVKPRLKQSQIKGRPPGVRYIPDYSAPKFWRLGQYQWKK